MAHIHEKLNSTVPVSVVHRRRLLVHHRQLDRWLPSGDHIELDEDPGSGCWARSGGSLSGPNPAGRGKPAALPSRASQPAPGICVAAGTSGSPA